MDKVEVTTRFMRDGKIVPIEINHEGQVIMIRDVGRQWSDDEGIHVLVMDFQDNTYHLLLMIPDFTWFLAQDMKRPPGIV